MCNRWGLIFVTCVMAAASGCGGSTKEPDDADDRRRLLEEPLEPESEGGGRSSDEGEEGESEGEGDDEEKAGGEVEFPENASVTQAINAVPQGAERINIDAETLAKPLQDPKLFEPCKAGNQHFTIKVAVWDGRAVGMDIKANSPNLEKCIRDQVKTVEWRDKVRSLNTVEFSL